MATPVLMPRLSPTMEEGVIGAWLKSEGDDVETSELICEIETDKASMEYESPDEGKIVKILAKEGETIKVDTLIAIIAEEGEEVDVDSFIANNSSGGSPKKSEDKQTDSKPEPVSESEPAEQKAQATPNENPVSSSDQRVKASPLAKAIAKDKNLDLATIKGSGPNGRIVASDVETVQPSSKPAAPAAQSFNNDGAEFEDVRNSTMRNVIAKRLLESSNGAPDFFLTIEIDMENVMAMRNNLKELYPEYKITFNDIVIKATALALKKNPNCNAYWMGDSIRKMNDVHISVAVAIEDGLITPVIRHADKKGLAQISAEVKELAGRAKNKKLQPEEYTGGTFSVSNLGMFGIEQFTSILNPPESGIFAVGAIIQKPIVKNGQMVIGNTMKITMTCDHRVIDGATGSMLLADVKRFLENPASMLV